MSSERSQVGAATSLTHEVENMQALDIPYLPLEVHRIIAQHVDSVNLTNYRLASKSLAEVGAEELFSSVTFHCSSASIARINAIKECEHLNKYVNTLIWDTNFWNIPDVRDLHEWERYFNGKAVYHKWTKIGNEQLSDRLTDIANNRQAWELYLDCVKDEKEAKKLRNLHNVFTGFQNLFKVHVLNGDLVPAHRGVQKSSEIIRLPQTPATYYRGESLYNDGGPIGYYPRPGEPFHMYQRPGGCAFALLRSLQGVEWPLTKLRLDAVCWKVLTSEIRGVESLGLLTSLHLKITIRTEAHRGGNQFPSDNEIVGETVKLAREAFSQHDLMRFLVKLPRLQSLKLDFGGHFYNSWFSTGAPSSLADVISEHHVWPDLQKLALRGFDVAPAPLLSLLSRHRSTLKVLKLHNIWLEPNTEAEMDSLFSMKPPEVFTKMREMSRLKRARLSGYFSVMFAVDDDAWDFEDQSLALAAAKYLVEGGICPLNDSNRCKT